MKWYRIEDRWGVILVEGYNEADALRGFEARYGNPVISIEEVLAPDLGWKNSPERLAWLIGG